MWERVRLFRTYQTKVVPGLLQTAGYMTGVLTGVRRERGVEVDDVADALAERIGRQGYLLQRDRQFVFVIEEPVLFFRPFGAKVQREKLAHLLDVMMLPPVSLSIIPMRAGRHGYRPRESFDITASDLVTIEMLTGFLSLTHPGEIASYVTAWEQMLAATDTSAIRLEMHDSNDQTEQGFAEWKATGGTGAYNWGDHLDVIRTALHAA